MNYKKYCAKTFQQAKLKMLLDVGHNAYIVSQKKIKEGGFLGLFGKPMIEITAGLLEHKSLKKKEETTVSQKMDPDYEPYILGNKPKKLNANLDNKKLNLNSKAIQQLDEISEKNSLKEELSELKSLVNKILLDKTSQKKLSQNINSKNFDNNSDENIEKISLQNIIPKCSEKTKELAKMLLKEDDFNDQFINTICSLSSVEDFLSREKNLGHIKNYLKEQINEVIKASSGISISGKEPNVIVLVGPTGVGKTTTLAKLGAYFGVFQKKKVKFISIDTYRVGAIQQLKLYADIMEIPFSKVNNIEEFRIELDQSDHDLILIDTTGRNQKNLDDIKDIKKYLEEIKKKFHISLVISATTKYKDLVEILDKFDILGYNNIILTKLDETSSLGQVISAISPKKCGLSYVTFGQSVPEDIEVAKKKKIFDMILKT